MGTIEWLRPSGTLIVSNDRQVTIDYAESLGWVRTDEAGLDQMNTRELETYAKSEFDIDFDLRKYKGDKGRLKLIDEIKALEAGGE